MKRDAEAHAAEDKKRRELVDLKNRADAMVIQTRKALEEHGAKVSPDGRSGRIENAISNVESKIKGDEKDPIEAAMKELEKASHGAGQGGVRVRGCQGREWGCGRSWGRGRCRRRDDGVQAIGREGRRDRRGVQGEGREVGGVDREEFFAAECGFQPKSESGAGEETRSRGRGQGRRVHASALGRGLFSDLPLFELDRRLAAEDRDQHADQALLGEQFVDRALVALERAFLDRDVLALLETRA
jgi:hypothetical protein